MDPRIVITADEYKENPDIGRSYDFYKNKFEAIAGDFKSYEERNAAEKAQFKQIIVDHYSSTMLNTTPVELDNLLRGDNEDRYLQLVSEWLLNHAFAGYLGLIENAIVNAHRDLFDRTKVNLPSELRKANRDLIKSFDEQNQITIDILAGWGQSSFPKL